MKQKHTLQWLSAVTGRAKGLVGLLVVVQTVLSVSSIAFAFVLRRIINMAVDGARGGFWASLALLVGILLGQIVLSATGRFLSEYTSATVENRFKHRLFSALLTGDYASVAAVHSGEWMNRLTSDTTVVAGGVTQIVPGLIGMLVRLLGAVTAILWLEPRFLYILLPGGAAMMLLTYAFRGNFSGELDLDIPPPLIRRKNSNRVEYNVHFSSYVGTFSIFPFIFRQKEKSHRPSDQ